MAFPERISFNRAISLSQWDKIILVLAATCALPLFLHALPFGLGESLGPRWLPIFYAPLIASLCFRPHVTIIVCLCAPLINHIFFGMPNAQVLPVLTGDLVVFNAILLLVKGRTRVAGWQVIPAYFIAHFLALLLCAHLTIQQAGDQFLASILLSAPGILVLAVIAHVVGRLQKR
jgi:hypothetical protein